MRKVTLLFLLAVCVSLGVYGLARHERRISPVEEKPSEEITHSQVPQPGESPARPAATVPSPVPSIAASISEEPKTRQHVFRLQLDGGRCTLEKMEEVHGDFGRERVPQWQSGMLCCRLIAQDGRIVGERTLPAPDYVCVVLDPNDASKVPTAARLTSDGPAIFQVRFPQITDAVRLEVHRIATESRPADAAAPVGRLIASLAIPSK